ncbi:unnamed protein product, partial [Mesorhabditis belari]|uniref:L-Fucosyltransferase n=1 Tax=Mesorhabditis belari TaxID=2138241 RepID=A0AAF3J5T5_9BILA
MKLSTTFGLLFIALLFVDTIWCKKKKHSKRFNPNEGFGNPLGNSRVLLARSSAFEAGGGIGNELFAVMSTLGVARKLRRRPVFALRAPYFNGVSESSLWTIASYFPQLVPAHMIDNQNIYNNKTFWKEGNDDLGISPCCKYVEPTKALRDNKKKVARFNGGYLQSYKYFYPYRRELNQKLLTNAPAFTKMSEALVPKSVLQPGQQRICIHTKRGSFLGNYHQATTKKFLDRTVEHFRNPKAQIILFGDDVHWLKDQLPALRRKFQRITIADKEGIPDVATWFFFRKHCHKVVLSASSSTSGWWAAYFAQMQRPGVQVFYNKKFAKSQDYLNQKEDKDYFLPGWKPLDFENGDD